MFSKEILEILPEVIKSWQVLGVTIALVIYLSIFFSIVRAKRRKAPKHAVKKKKAGPKSAPKTPEVATGGGATTNEELGLEES